MCENCWDVAGKPAIENAKTRKAADLIQNIYDLPHGGAGGYGHIVFDGWNIQDGDIDSCLEDISGALDAYELGGDVLESSRAALLYFKCLSIEERFSALAMNSRFFERINY